MCDITVPPNQKVSVIEADDFARRFKMRATGLSWFLGAGCSAAAGIPTANDMVWEFKQQIYVSQRKVSLATVSDLANPAVRSLLQGYFDASGRFPALGANDEYAAYFEAVWPSEQDRRSYLDSKMKGAKPSYGHLALATLMKADLSRIVWATNFDSLTADACARVYDSTAHLTVAALDAPSVANQAISAQRWPLEVKLHGDFRSRRLKNTNDELREQDAKLRQLLIDTCRSYGLVAVGYSGRDDSVMDTLLEAIELPNAFGSGLFWLHRGEAEPLPKVVKLLDRAADLGIDGGLVRIENFDEAMRDIVRLHSDLDTSPLEAFAQERQRWSPAPKAAGKKQYPVVRLNALPVISAPAVARRISCSIGGHAEVEAAIQSAGVDAIIARKRIGVLAFGNDSDLRRAFEPYKIADFDLFAIETHRLRYDSAERGLLRKALSRALAGSLDMSLTRQRSVDLLAPRDVGADRWVALKKLTGALSGSVTAHPELNWAEGVSTRLDWAGERLWLLIEPRIVFTGINEENRFAATDFARERTVRRYNRQLNDLLGFWAETIASGGIELKALNVSAGVDAVFKLSSDTAFSWRTAP
jgi:hypothetical protein